MARKNPPKPEPLPEYCERCGDNTYRQSHLCKVCMSCFPVYLPTEEEIEKATAAFRAEWPLYRFYDNAVTSPDKKFFFGEIDYGHDYWKEYNK